MERTEQVEALAALLKQAGHAHHEAFLATDGADPDWAIWYADHLSETLPAALAVPLTRTRIVCLLSALADEHTARADPNDPWPGYYARELTARFIPIADERLSLYMTPSCPFCRRVMAVVERLNIPIELRDTGVDAAARAELIEARGRATVPVLRCEAGPVDRWMPESADIINYLERRFGDPS